MAPPSFEVLYHAVVPHMPGAEAILLAAGILGAIDQRAIVTVAIVVPLQTIASLLAARWFSRRAHIGEPGK